MIDDIKRILSSGRDVYVDLIDPNNLRKQGVAESFIQKILESESIRLTGVFPSRIYISMPASEYSFSLPYSALECFKLKERTGNFDDLVDKAIKAVRDYVAIITHLELDNITIESINYDLLSPLEIYREDAPEKIQKAIDWIDSLYTETFVIDDVSDVLNCKGEARFVFSNGVEGEFLEAYDGGAIAAILLLESGKGFNIPFELLKGATVTQKRGKA